MCTVVKHVPVEECIESSEIVHRNVIEYSSVSLLLDVMDQKPLLFVFKEKYF